MKVSVIIPNYNHGAYLEERIMSVLNQTYKNFEIVLLDDCSTDKSKEVLLKYENHPHVAFTFLNEDNSGSTFKQWEKGLQASNGKFIWIAESDDIAEPTFLEEAIKAFELYPQVGIVKVASVWIDKDCNTVLEENIAGRFSGPINGQAFINEHMTFSNNLYNASSVVFKKELVAEHLDNSIKQMKYCGDWLFWIRMLNTTDIFIVDKKLNYYRQHDQNVSGNAEKNGLFFKEGLIVYKQIQKWFPSRSIFPSSHRIWASKLSERAITFKNLRPILFSMLKDFPSLFILYFFYRIKQVVRQ